MLKINVGEGSFPPENSQCQAGKLVRLLRYFTRGNYSDPVVQDRAADNYRFRRD